MSTETQLFQALEYETQLFNGQPIINGGFEFYYTDCDGEEQEFDLSSGFVAAYAKVYNERLGRVLKTWGLQLSAPNQLILNTQDTTFSTNGNYWIEIYYVMSGGYEIRLRYGKLIVK